MVVFGCELCTPDINVLSKVSALYIKFYAISCNKSQDLSITKILKEKKSVIKMTFVEWYA